MFYLLGKDIETVIYWSEFDSISVNQNSYQPPHTDRRKYNIHGNIKKVTGKEQ